MKSFADIVELLNRLTEVYAFKSPSECQYEFDQLKEKLCSSFLTLSDITWKSHLT